jgi:Mitochondrial ribosomal protein (VAR1)
MINIINNHFKFKEKYLSLHIKPKIDPKNINKVLKKRTKNFCSFTNNLTVFSKRNPGILFKGLPFLLKGFNVIETENILKLSPLSRKGLAYLNEMGQTLDKTNNSFLYPQKNLKKQSYPKAALSPNSLSPLFSDNQAERLPFKLSRNAKLSLSALPLVRPVSPPHSPLQFLRASAVGHLPSLLQGNKVHKGQVAGRAADSPEKGLGGTAECVRKGNGFALLSTQGQVMPRAFSTNALSLYKERDNKPTRTNAHKALREGERDRTIDKITLSPASAPYSLSRPVSPLITKRPYLILNTSQPLDSNNNRNVPGGVGVRVGNTESRNFEEKRHPRVLLRNKISDSRPKAFIKDQGGVTELTNRKAPVSGLSRIIAVPRKKGKTLNEPSGSSLLYDQLRKEDPDPIERSANKNKNTFSFINRGSANSLRAKGEAPERLITKAEELVRDQYSNNSEFSGSFKGKENIPPYPLRERGLNRSRSGPKAEKPIGVTGPLPITPEQLFSETQLGRRGKVVNERVPHSLSLKQSSARRRSLADGALLSAFLNQMPIGVTGQHSAPSGLLLENLSLRARGHRHKRKAHKGLRGGLQINGKSGNFPYKETIAKLSNSETSSSALIESGYLPKALNAKGQPESGSALLFELVTGWPKADGGGGVARERVGRIETQDPHRTFSAIDHHPSHWLGRNAHEGLGAFAYRAGVVWQTDKTAGTQIPAKQANPLNHSGAKAALGAYARLQTDKQEMPEDKGRVLKLFSETERPSHGSDKASLRVHLKTVRDKGNTPLGTSNLNQSNRELGFRESEALSEDLRSDSNLVRPGPPLSRKGRDNGPLKGDREGWRKKEKITKNPNLYLSRFRGSIDWGENSKKGNRFKSRYENNNDRSNSLLFPSLEPSLALPNLDLEGVMNIERRAGSAKGHSQSRIPADSLVIKGIGADRIVRVAGQPLLSSTLKWEGGAEESNGHTPIRPSGLIISRYTHEAIGTSVMRIREGLPLPLGQGRVAETNKGTFSQTRLLLKNWNLSWTKKKNYFKKLSNYLLETTDFTWLNNINEIRKTIEAKYRFDFFLSSSQIVNYSFNKNYKKQGTVELKSLYKFLKSFFSSLSALISKPIYHESPEKINIRLFYFIMPTKARLIKERKLKYLIGTNSEKDQKHNKNLKKIMTKFRIKEFLARWKESENLVRLPSLRPASPGSLESMDYCLKTAYPVNPKVSAQGGVGGTDSISEILDSENFFNGRQALLFFPKKSLIGTSFNKSLKGLMLPNGHQSPRISAALRLCPYSALRPTITKLISVSSKKREKPQSLKGVPGNSPSLKKLKTKFTKAFPVLFIYKKTQSANTRVPKGHKLEGENLNIRLEDLKNSEIASLTTLGKISQRSSLLKLADKEIFNNGINSLQLLKFQPNGLLALRHTIISLNDKITHMLVSILESVFGKVVEVDIKKLKYPYHDSNMLSQILKTSSYRTTFRNMMKRILYTATINNPTNLIRKQDFSVIPSFLSGIKVRLAGRIATQRVVPRFTVQAFQMGSLARGKINLAFTSRITQKNKRGVFSFTVTTGHFIENKKIKK